MPPCTPLCAAPQFTLYGDVANKKHVPDFKLSMKSAPAAQVYDEFKALVAAEYGSSARVKDGVFGAMMDVALVNDGPVTLVIDSPPTCPPTDASGERPAAAG